MVFLAFCCLTLSCDGFISHWHRAERRNPILKRQENVVFSSQLRRKAAPFAALYATSVDSAKSDRFRAIASNKTSIDRECIFTIQDAKYNLTAWANAHPGGVNILRKFHGKNATKAFHAAGHSGEALRMLESFRITGSTNDTEKATSVENAVLIQPTTSRWKKKLISAEDPQWIHKTLGIYALLHFVFRLAQLMFGRDPAAGFGTNLGRGTSIFSMVSLIPHLLLSCSSLIFDTVPRERVVGKPMIWKENRWHSIFFGSRSILCAAFAWLSYRMQHAGPWRSISIVGTCLCVLLTMVGADVATEKLRPSQNDSTVATLPFWDGCSDQAQRRIKKFYAFSQFSATSTCLLCANPAWPFSLLFPIQFSSFLLTLCRKGLISAKAWHIGYAGSLLLPFLVGVRVILHLRSVTFIFGLLITSMVLFQLRCLGVNKYLLWTPMMIARVLIGDRLIPFDMW
eukprot:scaffold3719_cov104-Cylindrotheca_fusiformis.AAC.5